MELFIEVLFFTLIGCSCGIVTGLVPGIHINMVAALVLVGLPALMQFSPIAVASWLMAMAVTHTFLDFIPSILLGAPEAESALSVLPGHRMLLQGRAMEAIKLTALGSLCSLLITATLFLFVISFVQGLYSVLKPVLLYILIFIALSSLVFEKKPHWGMLVFMFSGFFGFFALNSGLFSENILFPALSGLFGTSTMLLSLRERVQLPPQINAKISLGKGSIIKNSLIGSFAGMLVGLLPGVGAAQATYMTQQISRKSRIRDFLVAVSGVNTSNIIFTLVVLYAIGKMRSGITVAINEIVSVLNFDYLLIFLGVILLSGGIAMFLHLKIGIFMAKWLGGKDPDSYRKITIVIIFMICVFVLLLTGVAGLLILGLGTCIGLIPPLVEVRRAECMAFFIFPVILFYSGLNLLLLSFLGIA